MTRSKDIGTAAESAVVRFLQANGFPHAERRALRGTHDAGDITGLVGIAVEVKAGKAAEQASDGQVQLWLGETESERIHAGAEFGLLVLKRKGIGHARAGEWWCILTVEQFIELFYITTGREVERAGIQGLPVRTHLSTVVAALRATGYGNPL